MKIIGGIGNQFFQYALGKRLALERSVPLKLDLNWFGIQNSRKYHLTSYRTNIYEASGIEIYRTTLKPRTRYLLNIYNYWQDRKQFQTKRIIEEKKIGYDPEIINVGENAYLEGYWQSYLYFESISKIIRDEYQLLHPLFSEYDNIQKQIINSNSVGIHIRRGDYISNQLFRSIYHSCSLDYYIQAMEIIMEKVLAPKFFIFSDDIEWAKMHFQSISDAYIIHQAGEESDYQELILMSQCKHNIIANSSFSWWSAWLNPNPSKIVIAPVKWYKDPESNKQTEDLKYLIESIDSVLFQTFGGFEFIIIDDGSSDSSYQIINSYKDSRIRILKNEQNLGISISLNKGIKASQGKYIARMDSDDICMSDRLEKQLFFLEENPEIDVVGSFLEIIDETGNHTGEIYIFPSNAMLVKWITLFGPCLPHPAIMARKDFFIESGGYCSKWDSVEDYELWQRNNIHSRYSNLQEPLLKYRIFKNKISEKKYVLRNNLSCKIFNNGMLLIINRTLKISDVEIIQLLKKPQTIKEIIRVINILNIIYKKFSQRFDLTLRDKNTIKINLYSRKINILKLYNKIGVSIFIKLVYKFQRRVLYFFEKLVNGTAEYKFY